MCTTSVGDVIMGNEMIQNLMANPALDLIHKQVLMTLYALDAQKRLRDYKIMLPVYLATDWQNCEQILNTLASNGLIKIDHESISMSYPLNIDENQSSCGCMG
ncbi:MAG: hypothetical protein ACP5U1_07570 [Desulfomonilaceae bacterium]